MDLQTKPFFQSSAREWKHYDWIIITQKKKKKSLKLSWSCFGPEQVEAVNYMKHYWLYYYYEAL